MSVMLSTIKIHLNTPPPIRVLTIHSPHYLELPRLEATSAAPARSQHPARCLRTVGAQ